MSTDVKRHALNGATMGTRWSALVYAPTGTDVPALETALAGAVALVDRQMSTWRADSDLMRLNAVPTGEWVPLPPELVFVLAKGLEIGRASGGAFDIGLGDLVNAWGFGPAGNEPDAEAVRSSLGRSRPPAHALLSVDVAAGRARKSAAAELDLSGIAKGFGVDEMMRVVGEFGIESALIGLDGEIRARGTKPDGAPWAVALEEPDYEARKPMGVVALRDAGIATSGDYRHWVDVGETRLSHTMDRLRGGPSNNPVASVSVIAPSCTEADAWATALFALGPTEGPSLAERYGLDALFILRTGDTLARVPIGAAFDA